MIKHIAELELVLDEKNAETSHRSPKGKPPNHKQRLSYSTVPVSDTKDGRNGKKGYANKNRGLPNGPDDKGPGFGFGPAMNDFGQQLGLFSEWGSAGCPRNRLQASTSNCSLR